MAEPAVAQHFIPSTVGGQTPVTADPWGMLQGVEAVPEETNLNCWQPADATVRLPQSDTLPFPRMYAHV